MELSAGQTFGDYEILGVLGKGGMGKVYQVRNKISNRVEAMKILLSNLTADADLVDRFTREIRIFGSLDHPNIAELRTALRVENQLVMIMEFVEGSTLDALMKQGRIPTAKYLDCMGQALSALSYAHSKGVVHRDIKPANMMLTPSGVLKLMDFGIAKAVTDPKLTKTGFMVGSVYYVSPEQIEGKDLDARSDLYSLGVTLYELATGKRPFDGTSDYQIITAHMKENPPAPRELDASLPTELNDIIMLALAKDPAARFQSADAFKNALASVARGLGNGAAQAAQALPPITPPPAVSAKRNTRLLYMLAGSAATIAVIVGAVIEVPKIMHTNAAGQPAATQAAAGAPAPQEAAPAAPAPGSVPPAAEAAAAATPAPAAVVAQNAVPPAPAPTHAATPTAVPPARPVAMPAQHEVVQQVAQAPGHVAQPDPPPATQAPAAAQQPPAANQPPAAPVDAKALEDLRERAGLMQVRVATIRTSLQNLQRQQAASGLSLRGDMVAADQRLGYQMEQAESSLQQHDAEGAKKRLDAAERDLEKLESFFNK